MGEYGKFERKIAEKLNAFPLLKKYTKRLYQVTNFVLFRKRGFIYSLDSKVRIIAPLELVKLQDQKQEYFFGYYDKSPWNHEMKKMVFHEIRGDGRVNIVIFDKERKEKYIVGTSRAWNFQQGSMAQWIYGESEQIIFNDIKNGQLIARTVSLENGDEKLHILPVQAVHPKGKEYLSLNYKRLSKLRPDYGYRQSVDNFSYNMPLDQDGIWHYDLYSGNHIIYSPSGNRFVFVHRWFTSHGKFSRLYVANKDGTNLKVLLNDRMVSHFHWKNDHYIVAWAKTNELGNHYYLIDVNNGRYEVLGQKKLDIYGDGHPSFSPNGRWIITDTYPDKSRIRHLILYDTQRNLVIEIGRFLSPLKYEGQKRCDLHPRWSPDGNYISVDSAHDGLGKSYILDISSVLDSYR